MRLRLLCCVLASATLSWMSSRPARAGDLDAGARLARESCASCHALRAGDKDEWGPSLVGIVDRPVGTEDGYRYASFLRQQSATGATWTDARLRVWLGDSKAVAKAAGARTKMPAQNLSEAQLDALLAYLRTL